MAGSTPAFLGSGWAFPILPDPVTGRLTFVEGEADVDQSVELLLRTRQGERVMRPAFGTAVDDVLFDGDSDQNLHRLETTITDAIERWEPRVALETVRAERAAPGTVEVTVAYNIRQTNTRRSIVFPFYTGDPGAQP